MFHKELPPNVVSHIKKNQAVEFIHSCFITTLQRNKTDSRITKASKAIIIAVKVSEKKT